MFFKKHSSVIIITLMALASMLCLVAVANADVLTDVMGGSGVAMEYETALFDTDQIMSVDIRIDEDTWNEMLTNAMSEEYYVCDVIINGTRINNVAIRPKGNTSLSAIAMDPDSDRYSLKLEFDHFVDGQTCFGLDKLILNNNYADATNMKEAIIYDMYQYLDADASLYNYAEVSVNGEYWGVYLALEGVEESFMLRNFGTQDGELYKPEPMGMGGEDEKSSMPDMGDIPDFGDGSEFGDMPEFSDMSFPADMGDFDMSNMQTPPDGFNPGEMGGFSTSGGGADLNYTDDDLDSYSTIWEGEVTGTGDNDHRRVVTALKNISEGNDLETYLDIDNVLKYMAVHTFAVNLDSLSGNMTHNYYLYEYDGQLNIFPWDYNLSFGGMSMGSSSDGTEMINDAIDTPFDGTDFFDAILENDTYRAKYHEYLQMLVDGYVNGGRFDETYERIRSQIDDLVVTDPTAFYDADEYNSAADILYQTIILRAESIDGQLDGTIPSTDEGQRTDSSSLIDGSSIDIQAMGQFSMGGFGGGFEEPASSGEGELPETPGVMNAQGEPPEDGMPPSDGFDPNGMSDMGDFDPGSMPDMGDFDPDNMPDMDGFTPPEDGGSGDRPQIPGGMGGFSGNDKGSFSGDSDGGTDNQNGDIPSALSGMPGQGANMTKNKNVIITAGYLVLMIVAVIIVRATKRKKI